jgi:hypothetical protein
MPELPILISPEMSLAMRRTENPKIQTRRVVNPQPPYYRELSGEGYRASDLEVGKFYPGVLDKEGMLQPGPKEIFGWSSPDGEYGGKCPYGEPGWDLWFREKFAIWSLSCDFHTKVSSAEIEYIADNTVARIGVPWGKHERYLQPGFVMGEITPSIFMPRWASRITRTITDIKIEQIQDISPADVLAEGIWLPISPGCEIGAPPAEFESWSKERQDDWINGQARATYFCRCADVNDHIQAFRKLWDSINAKPRPILNDGKIVSYISYPWEDIHEMRTYRGLLWAVCGNPFVWVLNWGKEDQ